MDDYEWSDGESWDPNWDVFDDDSAEFLFPSPSAALAKGLISRVRGAPTRKTRPVVTRPPVRPTPQSAPVPPALRGELTKVYETMRRLEQKQDEQTRQLAAIQTRSTGLQTADLFRHSLTTAVVNGTPALTEGNWAQAAAQLAPAVQSWRGIGPSFAAKPVSTLAFPVVTGLLLFFLRKPEPPTISATRRTGVDPANPARVTLRHAGPGITLRYEIDGSEPTKSSREYPGTFEVDNPGVVKVAAFTKAGVRSEIVDFLLE